MCLEYYLIQIPNRFDFRFIKNSILNDGAIRISSEPGDFNAWFEVTCGIKLGAHDA